MNPITMAGGIAALAVLGYTHWVAFSAGEHKVQVRFDQDVIRRQVAESELKDQIRVLEHGVTGLQKEAQDAHVRETNVAAELIALQRTRVTSADRKLRDASAQLTAWISAKPDDSAALAECKAAATAYRDVSQSCGSRYRELGDEAQGRLADAVSRGLECERSYDAAEAALRNFVKANP